MVTLVVSHEVLGEGYWTITCFLLRVGDRWAWVCMYGGEGLGQWGLAPRLPSTHYGCGNRDLMIVVFNEFQYV